MFTISFKKYFIFTMPIFKFYPDVHTCCGCVTDLRTAAAIISVIAIITSPIVSWSMVRHSYAIRVACYVTTASNRVDVLDLTLNNIVSFGFGVNAGLGPSCMTRNSTSVLKKVLRTMQNPGDLEFVRKTKYFGWVVLAADVILAITSGCFLASIFKRPSYALTTVFMYAIFFAITFSCIYGLLYVIACMQLGSSLPLFELFFSFFDFALWMYFLVVINSYRQELPSTPVN